MQNSSVDCIKISVKILQTTSAVVISLFIIYRWIDLKQVSTDLLRLRCL